MDENDFISGMKELLRCYELVYTSESAMNKEIQMWRQRFINSLGETDDRTECIVRTAFIYTHTEEMIKQSPEQLLDELRMAIRDSK